MWGYRIGVDPYYLTAKAQQLGYNPQFILAGRRINDEMGRFIAQRTVKLMTNAGIPLKGAVVGIVGVTFKENVPDLEPVIMNLACTANRVWLVTGAAGFIGSHLTERLLSMGQRVVAIDNLSTGKRDNIEKVRALVGEQRSELLTFLEQDICDRAELLALVAQYKPEVVLHQAALGSVPRSIADPLASHQANVDGFVNMLEAARLNGVKRFVYASSSSVYGDIKDGVKAESSIGNCLSPYAVTKRANELYTQVYGRAYSMQTVGLRYLNVFGPRQDPNGQYAAVIPRWLAAMSRREPVTIFGDGTTSRDFCYIDNIVQANLLAASVSEQSKVINGVVNIACGAKTSLRQLEELLREEIAKLQGINPADIPGAIMEPFRQGDIKSSLANISLAEQALGYHPTHSVRDGIRELVRVEGGYLL